MTYAINITVIIAIICTNTGMKYIPQLVFQFCSTAGTITIFIWIFKPTMLAISIFRRLVGCSLLMSHLFAFSLFKMYYFIDIFSGVILCFFCQILSNRTYDNKEQKHSPKYGENIVGHIYLLFDLSGAPQQAHFLLSLVFSIPQYVHILGASSLFTRSIKLEKTFSSSFFEVLRGSLMTSLSDLNKLLPSRICRLIVKANTMQNIEKNITTNIT